jgi:hypothetical protein
MVSNKKAAVSICHNTDNGSRRSGARRGGGLSLGDGPTMSGQGHHRPRQRYVVDHNVEGSSTMCYVKFPLKLYSPWRQKFLQNESKQGIMNL